MGMIINPYAFATAGGGLPDLSLGFIDSSDHVAFAQEKWHGGSHATAPVSSIPGMNGKCYDDSAFGRKIVIVPETDEFTVSCLVRFRALGGIAFCTFINGVTTHIQLEMNSDGTIDVNSAAFTHTTTDVFAIDTTYRLEFYGLIHASAGAYRLKIDGVVPNKSGGGTMDQSGLDTQNGATATIDRWGLGDATLDTYSDDHAFDIAGNDIGPGQAEILYPNGAGDLTEMTPDTGNNWERVDEATQDGNTSYVQNTASNKRDYYTFQDRSVSGTPRCVQVVTTAKFNTSASTFKNSLRIGGVNYDGATTHTSTSAFKSYVEVWNTNPATSAAWTDTAINSLQAGFHSIDADLRVTQVVVEVWVTPP